MIKVVLVDDEPGNIELMQEMLQQYCKTVTVCGSATTIKAAVEMINTHLPELIFLDVEMKSETGFDLFKHFPSPGFQVIFATAHEQYALRAIRSSCLEYLLKPIDYKELIAAVEKFEKLKHLSNKKSMEVLLENISSKKHQVNKIAVPASDGLIFLNTSDIIYCEASSNYTIICTANNNHIMSSKTLKEYEEMLDETKFFRCHKSYLINLDHIKKFTRSEGFRVQMQNDAWIDIAVRKKDEFLDLFEKR